MSANSTALTSLAAADDATCSLLAKQAVVTLISREVAAPRVFMKLWETARVLSRVVAAVQILSRPVAAAPTLLSLLTVVLFQSQADGWKSAVRRCVGTSLMATVVLCT
jgi:hypothetical protein